MCRKIIRNRTRKLIAIKKVSLYSNQITFSYNQRLHLESSQYKQFPQKKKKGERENEREGEGKERGEKEEKKKMDGKSLCGRKGKGKNETWKKRGKEGEGEERRGRGRRIKNREGGTRSVPPPPDAFPSVKLGNNITPIKGRPGKNTAPTSRDPIELNRNLQTNPSQRRSNFEIPSRANLIYTP